MKADLFAIRPEYEQRAKSQQAFGLIDGPVMDVRVCFDKAVADYFKERQWHPTQKVECLKNGDVIVSLQAGGVEEILSWILSWSGYAKVLSPPELIKAYSQRLRSALKHFSS